MMRQNRASLRLVNHISKFNRDPEPSVARDLCFFRSRQILWLISRNALLGEKVDSFGTAEKLTISRRVVLVKWRKEKWEGRSDNMFTVEMIAPCGLDCSLCSYAQKKVIPCPGCSGPNENNRGEQYGKEG